MQAEPGEELDFNEGTIIGLRGYANVKQEKRADNGELTNRVGRWLTDKKKFPRVIRVEDDDEGGAF
jgi:hypothetical protein